MTCKTRRPDQHATHHTNGVRKHTYLPHEVHEVRVVQRHDPLPDPVKAMGRKRQAELELLADLQRELLQR